MLFRSYRPRHLELVVNKVYSPPSTAKARRKTSAGSRSSVPSIITAPPDNGLDYNVSTDINRTDVLPLYGVSDNLDDAVPYLYQTPDALRRSVSVSEPVYATSPTRHLSREDVMAFDMSGADDHLYEYQSAVDTLPSKSTLSPDTAPDDGLFSSSVPVLPNYGKALSDQSCIPTTTGYATAVHGGPANGASESAVYSLAQAPQGVPAVTVGYSTVSARPETSVDASGYVQTSRAPQAVVPQDSEQDVVFEGESYLPLESNAPMDRQDCADDAVPLAPTYGRTHAELDHDTSASSADGSGIGFLVLQSTCCPVCIFLPMRA